MFMQWSAKCLHRRWWFLWNFELQSPSMGIKRKIIILFKIVNDVLFYSLLMVFFTFCKSCLNENALQAVRSLIGCNALVFIKDKFQRKLNLFVIPWLKLVVNTKKCEIWHQKFDKGLEILWWWIFNMSRRTPLMFYESILLWSGLWGEVLLKPWTTLFAFGDFGGEANGAMFFGYEFELDYLESIHLNLNYQDWTE